MHATVGLLGHDAEQQRLRQPAALPRRVQFGAHVLVVLVAVDQRRPHVGQPATDAGLHGRVVLDHAVECVPLVVEQRRGACGLRHPRARRHRMVGTVIQRIDGIALAFAILPLRIGIALQQALVGGQQRRHLAAALLHARRQHVFHVLQRGIALRRTARIAVGHQHQAVAIAFLRGGHALLQRLRGGAIARRDALCQRNGRHQQQGEGGRDGPVTQTGRNRKRHQACIQSVSREGSPRRVPWARQDVAFL